jgi:hypothetical protein
MNNCARRVVLQARRVGRNPVVRRVVRSGALLRKTLVRTSLITVLPSGIDDVILHHKALTAAEAMYITLDSMTVSTLSAVATVLLTAAKL